MPKKYTLLKREAYFQVKSAKNDKVEAILKLGYAKRVRRCGTKYISKLKWAKYMLSGPILDVLPRYIV